MSSLKSLEKKYFEDLFGLRTGYVLDFTDATFSEFFRESVNINIDEEKYSSNGDSKAKRLRAFWETESDLVVGKVLESLLMFWNYKNPHPDQQNQLRYEKAIEIATRMQGKQINEEINESSSTEKNFNSIDLSSLGLDPSLLPVIQSRLEEIQKCQSVNAPLSVIFLCGSILEGILFSLATQNPRLFNQSHSAPKTKEGKSIEFSKWSLSQLINASYECSFLKLDVKKFSHELRDFRNYIHPFQQANSCFQPTQHTAEICFQVLKAALANLSAVPK
ncbi:MAG TPA: hypothetical protein PLV00_07365 [Caldisericia bacterium]|nr:hypothetical protein [Caldisericia bacterium]